MSKYASKIKEQLLKNCEERAKAFEATKDERRQMYDEFLNPRKSVIDTIELIVTKINETSSIKN